jgi:molybdopterin-guanine dinucleotide biosynthesis protein MobB
LLWRVTVIELGVVGARNSGKTTVIERLVRILVKKGFQVATAKHTSHFHQIDTPGKDSHRHREAGAALTVVISEEEVAVFARPDILDWTRIQELTGRQSDIWLVEGDRRSDRAKVLVTRKLGDLAGPPPKNIIATIGPDRIDGVAAHFESNDVNGLGSFIVDTVLCRLEEPQ